MRKLLLLPLFAMLACTDPAPYPVPVPVDSVAPAPVDSVKPKGRKPGKAEVEPVPVETNGFCHPGTVCDIVGDGRLARTVDPSVSTFQIIGMKFYAAGDPVEFIVCAKDENRAPVAGLPAIVRVKSTARLLAGDGLTLTGEDGCVVAEGTVTEADLNPGPGSYIVNAYIGGRLLNTVRVLPDSI
jgi:hypothetical protein